MLSLQFQKMSDLLEKFVVFTMLWTVFHCFSHLYAQECIAPVSLCSIALFERATGAIPSQLLFTEERREKICSRKNKEIVILLFHSQQRSDSHKKQKSEFLTLVQLD